MPASIDLGSYPAITHHPAQRLDPTLPRLPQFDPQQVFEQWAQLLKQMTGIDLSSPEALFTSIIGKLQEILGPIFGGINLTGGLTPEQIWAATIANPIKSLTGVDLSSPAALVASIIHLITGGSKFPGVLAISRIANVIQDLLDGAGDFLTADSVTNNPYWDWDSVMPGFVSGGSIRATANGTQQVMRSEPSRSSAAKRWSCGQRRNGPGPAPLRDRTRSRSGSPRSTRRAIRWPTSFAARCNHPVITAGNGFRFKINGRYLLASSTSRSCSCSIAARLRARSGSPTPRRGRPTCWTFG